jgi:hypothetical protein
LDKFRNVAVPTDFRLYRFVIMILVIKLTHRRPLIRILLVIRYSTYKSYRQIVSIDTNCVNPYLWGFLLDNARRPQGFPVEPREANSVKDLSYIKSRARD